MKRSTLAAMLACAGLLLVAACEREDEIQTKDVAAPEASPEEIAAPEHEEHGEHAGHDADEAAPAEGTRLEAHLHGTATLAITMDGNTLTAIFEAPLMSMVGFEHDPQTDDERNRINAAVDAFTAPLGMIEINRSAECLPQQTTSGTHMGDGHGALEVEHIYTCDKPEQIGRIDFLLMAGYPDLKQIDAVFLSDRRQAAKTLTQSDHVLELN